MQRFAYLIQELQSTNSTLGKVNAVAEYLQDAPDTDKVWCIALLTGRRPRRIINSTQMRTWAAEKCQVADWLFEESYGVVGDLAETIALLLPAPAQVQDRSLTEVMHMLLPLASAPEEEKRATLVLLWDTHEVNERFVLNKLLTGGFRIGISEKLLVRALAKLLHQEPDTLLHRLMGQWTPQTTTYHDLLLANNAGDDLSKPYPFMLAYPLELVQEKDMPLPEAIEAELGPVQDWQAEWKWDGIRSQLIVREGQLYIWSRGEELVTEKFPELMALVQALPSGTVLDGELLGWQGTAPLPFQLLQTRISRKNVSQKQLRECPVAIIAYDILEHNGQDIRDQPLATRRALLEALVQQAQMPHLLMTSAVVQVDTWEELWQQRAESRKQSAEGLMLKQLTSPYQTGRKRGAWWKWKVEPYTIDAVMIYAQRGHGRRANMYTDFTFAVWEGELLVPFAKAYSGLTDKEMAEVDAFVKKNTRERFGPVRSVNPELVFELAFEGINLSTRHKSGVAVRFPRIARWRKDKTAQQADHLSLLKELAALQLRVQTQVQVTTLPEG